MADLIHTPYGTITRDQYNALLSQYPNGIPGAEVARIAIPVSSPNIGSLPTSPTPSPTTQRTTTPAKTTSTTTDFKPDFSKKNPYEGAPDSYIQQIQGTQAYNTAVQKGWIKPISGESETKSTKDEEKREKLLREAVEFDEKVKKGEVPLDETMIQYIDSEEYRESLKDVKEKLKLIDQIKQIEKSYRDAGVDIPQDVLEGINKAKATVYGKAAPFVNLETGEIDIDSAIKSGVSDKDLKQLGISQKTIDEARENIVSVKEQRKAAAEALKVEKQYKEERQKAQADLKDYINQKTQELDIEKAIQDKVSVELLQKAGYNISREEYNKLIKSVEALERLGKVETIDDLARAIREGKIEDVRKAGFAPEDVAAAQVRATEIKEQIKAPEYGKAEADFNKVADEIWSREGLTDDEKAAELAKTTEWQNLQNAIAEHEQTAEGRLMKANFAIVAAELLLPGVYSARHWNDMSVGEKTFSIVLDVVSLVPFVGAVTRGARSGATFSRAVMAKNIMKEVGAETLAQIKGPINMIIHPVGTVKATGKQILNLTENIAHPKKIPYAVLTTTDGTVRIRITKDMSKADAMAARDIIMDHAVHGKKLLVEIGDQTVEVATSPFMREVRKAGGGLAHATPGGEVFEKILTVMKKEGMLAKEQGLYFANEPLTRFTKLSAFGKSGERPTIYITSRETAEMMVSSEKIYKNTAELERVLPVGAKTSGPQQRLITRIGPNADKVVILLEKPLSAKQIAKLRAEGIIESVKAPFKLAIKVKGKGKIIGLTDDEIEMLAKELRAAGNVDQARNLMEASRVVRMTRVPPRQLKSIIGSVRTRDIESSRKDLERAGVRDMTERTRVISREIPSRVLLDREVLRRTNIIEPDSLREKEIITTEERPPRVEDRETRQTRVPIPDRVRTPRIAGKEEKIMRLRKPGIDLSNEDKRQIIEESGGAIAWRQGKVGGKDRWDVVVYPYQNDEHYYMVLGDPPQGATIVKKGKGSAYATAQIIRGKGPEKKVHVDSGIQDVIITPSGRKRIRVHFMPDTKLETEGDITIGEESPVITERTGRLSDRANRISGRSTRITPRTPKLR